MTLLFEGVSAAVTTPFKDGEIDLESFKNHLQFLKDNDIQAFIINGTTGEGSTLTDSEKKQTIKTAIDVANKEIPVIATTGSNNTQASIDSSLEAKKLGVDGLLIITPYYNKTTQKGAIAHFTAIAEALVDLPIIMYDVPARTGMSLEADTVAKLSKIPNIVGLKDATGDLANLTRMQNLVTDDFAFYGGNDDIALPFYAAGGKGLISVVANVIPSEHQKLYELAQNNPKEAIKLNNLLFPFTDTIGTELNPISIKAVVSHIGFGDYELRLPLVELEDSKVTQLIHSYQSLKEGLNHL
ncbi:MAG TPA: 4-hydroxy-tetrahydrodipicolinate synthase [Candidatus Atopostipes pullistercoris]|uniref:4-hydroxy-tetrahydrodipicolinate synthase n=1 Tax=Candidatus Atopostipes pullistercoris TaxID=2838467 RepID=A0A9D2G1B4_9LACT|nr:4-hydroxy-tetrahydrodipicolinate synthase [Candidatus Atopostipes pullistercoris]